MSKQFNISNIFGLPNQGIHRYRFLGMAVVDLVATILTAIIIAIVLFRQNTFKTEHICFTYILLGTMAGLFLFSIVVHRLFRVNTALNVKLFGKI